MAVKIEGPESAAAEIALFTDGGAEAPSPGDQLRAMS
jgi:hypothetical protein